MSIVLFPRSPFVPGWWSALRARWTERRRRKEAEASLKSFLAATDPRLLDDIGVDRNASAQPDGGSPARGRALRLH